MHVWKTGHDDHNKQSITEMPLPIWEEGCTRAEHKFQRRHFYDKIFELFLSEPSPAFPLCPRMMLGLGDCGWCKWVDWLPTHFQQPQNNSYILFTWRKLPLVAPCNGRRRWEEGEDIIWEVFPATPPATFERLASRCRRGTGRNIMGRACIGPRWKCQAPLLFLLLPGDVVLLILLCL